MNYYYFLALLNPLFLADSFLHFLNKEVGGENEDVWEGINNHGMMSLTLMCVFIHQQLIKIQNFPSFKRDFLSHSRLNVISERREKNHHYDVVGSSRSLICMTICFIHCCCDLLKCWIWWEINIVVKFNFNSPFACTEL